MKDLFDQALEVSEGDSWLFCGNVDCALSPDFYEDLASRRGTVVEYMRQDVLGNPKTLEELFTFPREIYPIGIDGLAIRAGFYRELQPHFPDFVLGEPHWDTALSGILRNVVPVQRDSTRYYHPKHEQMWDLGRLGPAGKHNDRLYVDALTYGFCGDRIIGPVSDRPDTAVIVCAFGDREDRNAANVRAIRAQLEQDLWCDNYLVEMRSPGQGSVFPEDILSKVHHVRVDCPPEAEGVFQKEPLLNIGWRKALEQHAYDYLIFVDADVHCARPDWFRQIRARLQSNPAKAVQGFTMLADSVDPQLTWASLASAYRLGRRTDLELNPGVCWGLHRELVTAMGGFNPFSLGASGDSLFAAELLNEAEIAYDPWLYRFHWFHEIYRDLPFRAEFDCVDAELIHEHHGPLSDRNYLEVRHALASLGPVRNWLEVSPSGLVVWKNPDGVERRVNARQREFRSLEEADRILREMGIEPVPDGSDDFVPRSKPVFAIPGWSAPTSILASAIPHTEVTAARRLNVFNPKAIYRSHYPFSWCGNARRSDKETIPTEARDGVPRLIIEGDPGAPWVTAVLPVETNWQKVDVSRYSALRFTLRLDTPALARLQTELVLKLPDGSEVDSEPVNLVERGLEPQRRMNFAISLEAFRGPGYDPACVRLIKWTGPGSFSFELSRVYID